MTKGAGLFKTLEEKGPSYVSQLHVADIMAFLTNADPKGNVAKPKNKDDGLNRVSAYLSRQP